MYVYVCIYARMYVRMYVYIYVCVYVCIYVYNTKSKKFVCMYNSKQIFRCNHLPILLMLMAGFSMIVVGSLDSATLLLLIGH
jgi:hypothetical protein